MNAQDTRYEIIKECLPQLIKQISNLQDDDENLQRCEQFAWSIIRNHRNLSTNSHNVTRKIEGIKDKFLSENCAEYAEHFGELCKEIIQHPICIQHYEVDVHWSLLDFLVSMAYNPGAVLRRNKHNLLLHRPIGSQPEKEKKPDISYWQKLLKQDCIPMQKNGATDSDLSDWSDDSSAEPSATKNQTNKTTCEEDLRPSKPNSLANYAVIKPPQKPSPYLIYNGNKAEKELLLHVQHSWWLTAYNQLVKHMPIESGLKEANTSHVYIKYLQKHSNNLLKFNEPATATEYCLLRELIWMFHAPQNCKFFKVTNSSIFLRPQVTIPSAIEFSLYNFMDEHFLPYLKMMRAIDSFTKSFYKGEPVGPQCKTLECYGANLRTLLQPVCKALLQYEERLIKQADYDIFTLLSFQREISKSFSLLSSLYSIHTQVLLRQPTAPTHIHSAYLLSGLLQQYHLATNAMDANLAMSLFLTSVKVFCVIIDTWWTEGRLDDFYQEFIVERINQSRQVLRPFKKDKATSFFVSTQVSQLINHSPFFQIIHDFALEAGCTLNLLYEINHIGVMRKLCTHSGQHLYDEFMEEIMKNVQELQKETQRAFQLAEMESRLDTEDIIDSTNNIKQPTPMVELKHEQVQENNLKLLSTNDMFLLQAFASSENEIRDHNVDVFDGVKTTGSVPFSQLNALEIVEYLQEHCAGTLLPLQQLIVTTLKRLLDGRITVANAYVLRLYREDFQLQRHQQYLRRVLLLEASDLMYNFYEKLFKEIESGQSWANPFQLTTQLDDVLSRRFPDMSSLFRVDIKSFYRCQTKQVCAAVDELIIHYNFSVELSHVINTTDDLQQYNVIFRFLLKIKWALHVLEHLHFSTANKRRPAYMPFRVIDLLMRRLQQVRFWMLFAMQSIHFHIMTQVLQKMGEQLDLKLAQCQHFKQMQNLHAAYVRTIVEHSFLTPNFKNIKATIDHLLSMVIVLRTEWNNCVTYIDNLHPLTPCTSENEDTKWSSTYITNASSVIDNIEINYIQFHQSLANQLNDQVYLNQHTFCKYIVFI